MTLKLNQPAELADHPLSAGPMIREEIDPGVPGNWFGKLSRRARAGGDVSIREAFVAHEIAGNAELLDAGVVISAVPAAAGVDVVLFRVPGQEWAYHSEAVAFVEAYTQAGQEMDWRIFGSHLEGFRTLRLWGLLSSPLPGVGSAIFLTDENVGEAFEQPFRIDGMTVTQATYALGSAGAVDYQDALIELSAPLERDLDGDSTPDYSLPERLIKVREGQVADNAKYYGASPLTEELAADEVDVKVAAVFAPIVPASRSSTAIVDALALPRVARRVVSGVGHEYTDPSGPAHTDSLLITGANRGHNYSFSLAPLPAAGAFQLKYQSLGNWITLRDNGDGTFGTPGRGGSGTVSQVTGTVTANLDNAPDLGSYIVLSWGTYQQFARLDGQTLAPAVIDAVLLPGTEPGTLGASWTEGGVAKSLGDDGAGNLTGDASGKYYYGTGQIVAQMATLPDGDIDWITNDGAAAVDQDVFGSVTVSGGRVRFTLATALPIVPGSATVWMEVNHRFPDGLDVWGQFTTSWLDDGNGIMVSHYGDQHGTVNYATGEYDLPEVMPNHTTALRWVGGVYVAQAVSTHFAGVGPVRVVHSATGGANIVEGVLSGYSLRLGLDTVDSLVPGALIFTLGGDTYRGAAGGGLERDGAPGVSVGSVGQQGEILVSDWIGGGGNTPGLLAALARGEDWSLTTMHWGALGFPLQAGQLSMVGTSAAGDLQNAGTDNFGAFTGDATGFMVFDSGFGLTTWAQEMDPASITHSGVVLTLIPLDKELIGIDAARLPADGKVPIFNPGGLLAVGDSQDQVLPDPLSAAQVVPLAVSDLTTVQVLDANGLIVDAALYSVDLEADIITMSDPLDLTGFVEPLVAVLHWDDEGKIVEVQPSGIVTLAAPLPRVYSVGAMASAILYAGDLQAHAPVFFDQKTWDNTYSDSLDGDAAAATYNLAGFPVEVDNDKAPTERWAVHFLTTTSVAVVGERLGNLGTFDFTQDLQPVDPATGLVAFRLRAAGRGEGWIPGNVIRFNVITAAGHFFGLRCVSLGAENLGTDEVVLKPRGDE